MFYSSYLLRLFALLGARVLLSSLSLFVPHKGYRLNQG